MKRFLIGLILFAAVAGVVYLATLGCCQLMRVSGKPASLSQRLQLTSSQRQGFISLERGYLAQKDASCQRLCQKRAQLIELLKAPEPDRPLINSIVGEIGQEQTALERVTMDYLLTLRQQLSPEQESRLIAMVSEQLDRACEMTACSAAGTCFVTKGSKR